MTAWLATGLLICVGIVASFSATLNANVGRQVGTLRGTRLFLITGSLTALGMCFIIYGTFPLEKFLRIPGYFYIPGALNLFTVAFAIKLINRLGTMLTTAALFTGQIVTGLLLDNSGFVGLPTIPITSKRALASAVLIIGVIIIGLHRRETMQIPHNRIVRRYSLFLLDIGLPVCGSLCLGGVNSVMAALNAVLGQEVTPLFAVFLFLAPGALILLAVGLAVPSPFKNSSHRTTLIYTIPGILNVCIVAATIFALPFVGLQVTAGAKFTASLLAAGLLDHSGWLNMPRRPLSGYRLFGLSVLVAGVVWSVRA